MYFLNIGVVSNILANHFAFWACAGIVAVDCPSGATPQQSGMGKLFEDILCFRCAVRQVECLGVHRGWLPRACLCGIGDPHWMCFVNKERGNKTVTRAHGQKSSVGFIRIFCNLGGEG